MEIDQTVIDVASNWVEDEGQHFRKQKGIENIVIVNH